MDKQPIASLGGKFKLLIAVVTLGLLLSSIWLSRHFISYHGKGVFQVMEAQAEQGADEYFLYSPIILKGYPAETVFGMVMDNIREGNRLDLVVATDTKWTRAADVAWSDVEPNEGQRDWSVLDDTITQWQSALKNGLTNIVVVDSTPSWAQKVPGYFCGPIKQNKFGAFADFMYELVDRYSEYPYHIKYWEIWNEPDVDPTEVKPDSIYGCWGDKSDPNYGGGYYAEMLKVVYPKIKAADPTAKVLVGGLLLDCDPNNPPSGKDCTPAKFLEGILKNGGAPYFDGVSFHAYEYYAGTLGEYSNNNWNSTWNTTGPVVIAKTQFLKSVQQKYQVSDKFLINTEGALLCGACVDDAGFETTKAYYIAQSYATAIAQGLEGNLWYSFSGSGWQNTGIIDSGGNPLPGYDAYKFAARELIATQLLGEIEEYPGVMGYEFVGEEIRLWVIWSYDGEEHTIQLPGAPEAVYNVFGEAQPITQDMNIDLVPTYIEWSLSPVND
ncbi:MAG: hypothetical protein PVG32_19505 [Anaerolineales bacterium]